MRLHNGVVGREGFKFVFGGHEWMAGGFRNVCRDPDVVPLGGVDPSADGRATQGQLLQVGQGVAQGLQPKLQLRHVPAKLLTQGQRRRVHQVGAANLHHVVERLGLGLECVAQPLHPRKGGFHHSFVSRDVHGGGERVVGALALVHVVVGVDRTFALTQDATRQDVGAVRHDLVHVHVALGARPCLPHHQRKLVVQLACEDFLARRHNQVLLAGVQHPEFSVGQGRGPLQMREGTHHLHGHRPHRANLEVVA